MLRILLLLTTMAVFTPLSFAQSLSINSGPQPYATIRAHDLPPSNSIEIVEFFSYGCSHCADFQPYMDDLKTRLPASARLRLIPVVFNPQWDAFSRAFYAAERLGVSAQTHQRLFDYVSSQRPSLPSLHQLATQFYRQFDVDPVRFMAVANSAEVTRQVGEAYRLAVAYGVDRTPTLAVNGRFRIIVDPKIGVSQARAIDLALDLVDK